MTLKNKITASIITLLLLVVCFIVFLIRPLYKDIEESSLEIVFEKQKIVALESKIKNIEEFRKNYQGIKENLEKVEGLFINSEAPVDFISFLEESSQITRIPLEISPSSVREEGSDKWPSIAFSLSSTCPFTNFLRFLEKLESGPYLIKVTGLNIGKLTEKEMESQRLEGLSFGDVQVSLSIKVFAN